MQHKAAFMSVSHDWRTPKPLFDALDAEFGFTLDAAASAENALCERFLTEGDDALARDWEGRVFCNPPYGRRIGEWVRWGYIQSRLKAEVVVMLIPARTETTWWHLFVMHAAEIRLVKGRIRFGGGKKANPRSHNATFPSCVVVFRRGVDAPLISAATLPRGDAPLFAAVEPA